MIAASILEYMFITVTRCKEKAKKLFEHRIEVCGRAYFGIYFCIIASAIRITAEQIPGLSTTLHLDFQDFTEPNSISRTFQVLEILQTQLQDFPGPCT